MTVLLPLTDPLVATFSETRAPTSRKYVAEQGIVMPNWSKTFQTFWSHSSVFALEKQPKNLNFDSVFTSKRPFGGYFQWNACAYFQKICSWTRYSDIPNWSKTFQIFLSHSLVFAVEKQPKNLSFHSVFTSKRPLGGYFQWNACTYFWKICSWRRDIDTKLIKNFLNFLVALIRYCFRKIA